MALLDPIPSSSSVSPSSVTGGNTQGFAAELDKNEEILLLVLDLDSKRNLEKNKWKLKSII